MAAKFEGDPARIRRASAATKRVGDHVQEVISTLQGVVAANDGGWGNDEYGTEFKKGYEPARDSLNQVTASVRSELGRVADDEVAAAQMMEATEQRSAQDIADT